MGKDTVKKQAMHYPEHTHVNTHAQGSNLSSLSLSHMRDGDSSVRMNMSKSFAI